MSLAKVTELKRQRVELWKKSTELLDAADSAQRDLTAEESTNFDEMHAEIDRLGKMAERLVRQHDLDEEMNELEKRAGADLGRGGGSDGGSDEPNYKAEFHRGLRLWATGRASQMNETQRNLLRPKGQSGEEVDGYEGLGINLRLMNGELLPAKEHRPNGIVRYNWDENAEYREEVAQMLAEERAQSVGTTTAGGHTVPDEAMRPLEEALLAFGGMRQANSTVIRTNTGANLPIPTDNDTSNKGAVLAENTQVSEQDITYGQVTLSAHKYTSKLIRLSMELLQDSSIAMGPYLGRKLGMRIGRITNEHATTGTGTAQLRGVTHDAAIRNVASATAVAADELIDLEHDLDPAYRAQGAEFMFHDLTLKSIKKLKDGDSRYLWLPGLAMRAPDTILGYGYIINQDMPKMAADNRSVLFGAFEHYWIRDVLDITVLRLVERYADFGQTAFVAFSRHDAKLVNPGVNPMRALRHPAS